MREESLAEKSAEQGVHLGAEPGDRIFPAYAEEQHANRKEELNRQERHANHDLVRVLVGTQG